LGFDFPPRHQKYLLGRPSEPLNTDYTWRYVYG